jgi:hypothetical protein
MILWRSSVRKDIASSSRYWLQGNYVLQNLQETSKVKNGKNGENGEMVSHILDNPRDFGNNFEMCLEWLYCTLWNEIFYYRKESVDELKKALYRFLYWEFWFKQATMHAAIHKQESHMKPSWSSNYTKTIIITRFHHFSKTQAMVVISLWLWSPKSGHSQLPCKVWRMVLVMLVAGSMWKVGTRVTKKLATWECKTHSNLIVDSHLSEPTIIFLLSTF